MKRLFWPVLLAIVILAVGGVLGIVGGAMFLPIIGFLAMVAILIWLFVRRAEHRPPLD